MSHKPTAKEIADHNEAVRKQLLPTTVSIGPMLSIEVDGTDLVIFKHDSSPLRIKGDAVQSLADKLCEWFPSVDTLNLRAVVSCLQEEVKTLKRQLADEQYQVSELKGILSVHHDTPCSLLKDAVSAIEDELQIPKHGGGR